MAVRIGVDVGGTFTDLILYDDQTGEVRVAKASTTPTSPDQGVMNAVREGVPERMLGDGLFLHGTTVGLNALLERRGAEVGLLTTAGFRDVLEIRRGEREELISIVWKAPPPLVPRRRRLEATERVLADGSVLTPLDADACAAAAREFTAAGVDSVAIVFLNAYANPTHELAAERLLREHGFEGAISVSHRVSGEYREYERTSTCVIDAYVRPGVTRYLGQLDDALAAVGFEGELLVTRSGGGAMTFAEAAERPFETIQSGPVAGAVGAAELCRRFDIAEAVTADVGGTSFDTCLVLDGRPQVRFEGRVIGMPVQTPWVDVRSIGAGGGSVAQIEGDLMQVGPRSAGAVPGPACYGRGGTEPTVTDAAAALGMLGFGELAGGVQLDFDRARAALEPLAGAVGRSLDETARGILAIANASMANAIRSVSIEQGRDPRAATLIAFGGAGPVFACQLARELGMSSILVPNYAGNFSAWGLLGQDLVRATARTMVTELDEEALASAGRVAGELFAELEERAGAGTGSGHGAEHRIEVALDLRYASQEHTRTIPVEYVDGVVATTPARVRELFAHEYEQVLGHLDEETIELVAVRASTTATLPRRAAETIASEAAGERRQIDAYSFTNERREPFTVVPRTALAPGEVLSGPAIVTEQTTTTYVDAGFELRVDDSGALFLEDRMTANECGPVADTAAA